MTKTMLKTSATIFVYFLLSISYPKFLFGQFSTPHIITSCNTCKPTSLSVGDIDGDKLPDILTVSSLKKIAWHKNLGDSNFSDQIILTEQIKDSKYAAIADLNKNNKSELIVLTTNGSISIVSNLYEKELVINTNYQSSITNPIYLFAGNLDEDKYDEIIVASKNRIVIIDVENNIVVNESLLYEGSYLRSFQIADIDNDSALDISFIKEKSKIVNLSNIGSGQFKESLLASSDVNWESFVIVDINQDRHQDIVIFMPKKIIQKHNDGNMLFPNEHTISDGQTYRSLKGYSFDIDNDGDSDILSDFPNGSVGIAWLENSGTGEFIIEEGYPSKRIVNSYATFGYEFLAKDLNNDGYHDIAYIDKIHNKTGVFVNNGNGQFKDILLSKGANRVNLISRFNFHADTPTVVLSGSEGNNRYYLHSKDKDSYSSNNEIIQESNFIGISMAVADLDNDHDNDIVSVGHSFSEGRICWFENKKNDNYTIMHPIQSDVKWIQRVRKADLDNDGDIDILYSTTYLNGVIGWHENLGDGKFSKNKTIIEKSSVKIISCHDFDGDGLIDILIQSHKTKAMSWLKNHGNASFEEIKLTQSYEKPKLIYCKDVNGDKVIDILTYSRKSGIRAHINNGSGTFDSKALLYPQVNEVTSIDVIDYDKNNTLDLVYSTRKGLIKIAKNIHNKYEAPIEIANLNSKVTKMLTCDYDNDGFTDIIALIPIEDKIVWLENRTK